MSQSFAGTLRRVMKLRKVTADEVAEMAGASRSTVSTWLTGHRHIPTPETAARLAKALDAPYLAMAAHEERARTCDYCGRGFEAFNRRSVARFCSYECRTRWWHVERQKRTVDDRLAHLVLLRNHVEALLAEQRRTDEAVAAHCRWCEPEGVCRDALCALRGLSPFVLVEERRRIG